MKTSLVKSIGLALALFHLRAGTAGANAQPVVVTNVAAPAGLTLCAVNPALNKLYFAGGDPGAEQMVVMDGVTFSQTAAGSGDDADVDTANNNYWSAGVYSGGVTVWGGDNSSITNIPLGNCPVRVSVDASHRVAWVGAQCGGGNDPLWAINADTYASVAGPIGSGGVQGFLLVNPATGRLYITPSGVSKRVSPSTFAVSPNAFGNVFAVNPVANLLYAQGSGGALQIINGAPDPEVVLATVAIPFPWGGPVGVNPALNRIYIGNGASNNIAILDATTGQTVGSVSLGAGVSSVGSVYVDASRNLVYAMAVSAGSSSLWVIQDGMAQNGAWTEETPAPGPVSSASAAALNSILYVAGGDNGPALSTLYAYNPASNTWSSAAPMPGPRLQMDGLAVMGNKLYLVGGWTFSPPLPNNNLWVYDPVSNTWDTSKAAMPLLSGDGACGVISNKLYVTTPDNGYSGYYNFLHVYDPVADAWTALAPSPDAHVGPGYGVIGGKFYVVGGYNASGEVFSQLDVYDPSSGAWTTKSPMPTARNNPSSAVLNGKLYVIGGSDSSGSSLDTMEVYDPVQDSWTTGSPMITPRAYACGAALNGVIYAVGGNLDNGPALSTNEAYAASGLALVSSNDPLILEPFFLASDGVNLYVSGVGPGSGQSIFRLPLTGGAASVLENAVNPSGVAVAGTNVYWIDPNAGPITDTEILQAPESGGGVVTPIYIGSQVGQPIVDGSGLTSDGSVLYAADEVSGSVWRANLDGSGLAQIGGNRYSGGFSTEHLNTIAVSQGVLYIADSGQRAVAPQVTSIATNGASFATLASGAPLVDPSGIAVGNGMIYVSDPGANNTIWQLPVGGGAPTALLSGPPFVRVQGLAFVNGTLYIADPGGDAIYSFSPPSPPAIVTPPANTTTSSGGTATLSVAVSGTPPFTFQWQLNGTSIPGATNSSLTIANFSATNAGVYTVTVSNALGGVASAPVSVAGVDLKMLASVIIQGFPGLSYTVQATPALGGGGVWTTLTNVTLATSPYIYIDYGSLTNSLQYYRVVPTP
jgi:N-acetylneuraminic acid mutarotase